ncbi:MAG: YlxR family protein [Bifidobacteriaceae bacterium]|nr:YlxR family protein [Bifidobacteriaceae bacterium]
MPSAPIRTCVGCRARCPRSDLVRVVRGQDTPGVLVADVAARLPGRGAWVHASPVCLEQALRRGAFQRTLRWNGEFDASGVTAAIQDLAGTRPLIRPRRASGRHDGHAMSAPK